MNILLSESFKWTDEIYYCITFDRITNNLLLAEAIITVENSLGDYNDI